MTDAEKKLQQEIGQQILLVKIIQEQSGSLTGFYGISRNSFCKWTGYTKAEIGNLIGFTGVFDLHTFLLRFLCESPLERNFKEADGRQYLAWFLRNYGFCSFDREFWTKCTDGEGGFERCNDRFRKMHSECKIPEEATIEVLTEVLDFEADYLFSSTLEAMGQFEMDVIQQMLSGMGDITGSGHWFSVFQKAFEQYALKKFSDWNWVAAANEEDEKEKERIRKWLQDHPEFVSSLEKADFEVKKKSSDFGSELDVDFVREMLKKYGLQPDFTPKDLLEVWKRLPLHRGKEK